jgi:hypothetical protein
VGPDHPAYANGTGRTLRTDRDVPPGGKIAGYAGLLRRGVWLRDHMRRDLADGNHKDWIIDPSVGGNDTREICDWRGVPGATGATVELGRPDGVSLGVPSEMFVFACAKGLKKGDELLLDYGPHYWDRAGHVITHIQYYSLRACREDAEECAEFFKVWWAANAVGEEACFTYETLAACERMFHYPTALLNRVRKLGWQARRTPLAGVRRVGADNVSGGVLESCDRAPGVAPLHFCAEKGFPLVTATIGNLPAVVYQSSKAYCVPYVLSGCRLSLRFPRSTCHLLALTGQGLGYYK